MARQLWEEMSAAMAGMPLLTQHAEAHLRLAYLAIMDGDTNLAAQRVETASRIFAQYGRAGSIGPVDTLLAAIETGEALPDFEAFASHSYPSY